MHVFAYVCLQVARILRTGTPAAPRVSVTTVSVTVTRHWRVEGRKTVGVVCDRRRWKFECSLVAPFLRFWLDALALAGYHTVHCGCQHTVRCGGGGGYGRSPG